MVGIEFFRPEWRVSLHIIYGHNGHEPKNDTVQEESDRFFKVWRDWLGLYRKHVLANNIWELCVMPVDEFYLA